MLHTWYRSCYNSLHLVYWCILQVFTVTLKNPQPCSWVMRSCVLRRNFEIIFHKLCCSKVQPGEGGKCACELYSQAVSEGIKILFVKLSNRWLWMGEWQLLAILLHQTVVISAAATILSRPPHGDFSFCMYVWPLVWYSVCGSGSYLAVQSLHHYPWVDFAHKPCSRWWEIQTWTTQVIIY